jgi:hypothetical protein
MIASLEAERDTIVEDKASTHVNAKKIQNLHKLKAIGPEFLSQHGRRAPQIQIRTPCPKQRASTARTAPQSTSLFAPRRDRHQTTRLNVAGVARRLRAAKASSFLSIFSLVADGPKPRRRAPGKGRRLRDRTRAPARATLTR